MLDDAAIAERLQRESPLPVRAAARLVCAERGRLGHVRPSTLIRWIVYGKHGVRLEAFRGAGCTWYTSAAALARFFGELSRRARAGAVPQHPVETGAALVREAKALERLRQLGVRC